MLQANMNIIQLFQHKHTQTHTELQNEFFHSTKYLLSTYYVPEMMSGFLITAPTWSWLLKSPEIIRINTPVKKELQYSELLDRGWIMEILMWNMFLKFFKCTLYIVCETEVGLDKCTSL